MKPSGNRILARFGWFCLITFFAIATKAQPCDTIIEGNPGVYTLIRGSQLPGIGPGSTICLKGGKYYQIKIDGINGEPGNPVIIRPYQSEVIIDTTSHYGIRLGLSSHILLDGSLDGIPYGIRILKTKGVGISIDELSTEIEIKNIEVSNTGQSGIMAKTDPDCSFQSVRDSFLMRNIRIHHNYLHHIGYEGMYIGNVYYDGKTIQCNGVDTVVLPHLLEGVYIYNNYIYKTGYDGIQVSGVIKDCYIFQNQVFNDSELKKYGQMSGIITGKGSLCDCYNNTIANGAGTGIEIHGASGTRVFNNLIIEPGRSYRPLTQGTYSRPGIFVGYNLPGQAVLPYRFFNNTIFRPKSEGIRFSNVNSTHNEFYNNIIVDPGIWHFFDSAGLNPLNAFINVNVQVSYTDDKNFKTRNIEDPMFVSPEELNYMIQPGSPCIDMGRDLSSHGLVFDLNNAPRPWGNGFDAGAYEYYPGQEIREETIEQPFGYLVYKPALSQLEVVLNQPEPSSLLFSVYNISGQLIHKVVWQTTSFPAISLPVPALKPGIYILRIVSHTRQMVFKFLVQPNTN